MTDLELPDTPLLALVSLSLNRGEERIFGPLSFELRAGEAILVEGANGSGKTSLLRTIAGWLPAGEGEIRWLGQVLDAPPAPIGWLGHRSGLKTDLSARENLRAAASLFGVRSGISHAAALQSVGLDGYENVPLRRLSQGQNRRAALAALMTWPVTVWLLDEPYANLDRQGQTLVDRMLQAHLLRGGAALMTSHGLIDPKVDNVRRIPLQGGERG